MQIIPTRCAVKVFGNVQQEVQPIKFKTESDVKGTTISLLWQNNSTDEGKIHSISSCITKHPYAGFLRYWDWQLITLPIGFVMKFHVSNRLS